MRVVYDLEIARPLPGGDHPRWDLAHECGISVLVAWHFDEHEPRIYLPQWQPGEVRRFLADVEGKGLVSWNGIGFDDAVIGDGDASWALRHKRVDLSAICGLFGIAAKKGIDASHVEHACRDGVPENYPTIVGYHPRAYRNVRAGWSLEPTYCTTFEVPHAKSIHGSAAPLLWQSGRYAEVIGYCVGDVYRLARLYHRALIGEEIQNEAGVRVRVPAAVL